jgi:hypothetical protein
LLSGPFPTGGRIAQMSDPLMRAVAIQFVDARDIHISH